MSEEENRDISYTEGMRRAWLTMLRECLKNLGYDSPESRQAAWVNEREEAIAQLRSLCEEFGDNEWGEDLHLADIIEKHLGRYLK